MTRVQTRPSEFLFAHKRFLLVALALVLDTGCGQLLPTTRAHHFRDVEDSFTETSTAWVVCGRRAASRTPAPSGTQRLASYARCSIVVGEPELEASLDPRAWRLGPVSGLAKTDPAALIKGVAKFEQLHVYLSFDAETKKQGRFGPIRKDISQYGCESRYWRGFECPHSALEPLLNNEKVVRVQVMNQRTPKIR